MKGLLPSFLLLLLMLQVGKLTAHPTLTQADKDEFRPFLDLLDYLNVKNLLNSEDPISHGEKSAIPANLPQNDNAVESGLVCFPDVSRFSVNGSSAQYYDCSTGVPVLETCPPNHLYNPENEKCEPPRKGDEADESADMELADASEGNDEGGSKMRQIVQPTFGQEVFLGNPYDARKQTVYSSDFIWNAATINRTKRQRNHFSSNMDFNAVQSTLDRMALMDISAHLKLDVLGGLVTVEGSAKYFKETVLSENVANVVMEAHYKTRSETIPSSTPKDDIDLCKLKDATHIVTGISYGMDAYFDFRRKLRSDESKEAIEGELKVAIKSIPSIQIDLGVKVKINGSLRETSKKIRAKVRGDFILKKQPTSYDECVLVYKNLTDHLGPSPTYPRAVPKLMMLTPIKRVCGEATAILLKIKATNIMLVTRMMDEIEKTKIKAKTIQQKTMVKMYLAYEKLMNLFVSKLEEYELEVKGHLQKILPQMRSGSQGGKDLTKLLFNYTASPFHFDSASTFLKTREKELQLFDYILDPKTYQGKNVHFKYKPTATMIESIIFTKPKILILKLNVLPDKQLVEKFLDSTPVDETTSWFNNNTMIAKMGGTWRKFMEFAKANEGDKDTGFIVEVFPFKKDFCNVLAMKDAKIISENFDIPSTPPPISVISNNYKDVAIGVVKSTSIWVKKLEIRKELFVRKGQKGLQPTSEVLDFNAANRYAVHKLEPNTKYLLAVRYITDMGVTFYSAKVDPLLAKPFSPPANITSSSTTKSSVKITWDEPAHIGTGMTIVNYTYALKKGIRIIRSGTSKSKALDFGGLEPATHYTMSITALTTYNNTEEKSLSHPSVLTFVTSPAPPYLVIVTTSFTSAQVSWEPPKIAAGATVQRYLVRYTQLATNGTDVRTKTMVSNETQARIGDLVMGLQYAISVKVITSKGESDFSPRTMGVARHNLTYMAELKQALEMKIDNVWLPMQSNITNFNNKVNQLDSTVVKLPAGTKLSQSMLPAGYSTKRVSDLQVEALHMAAIGACRGMTTVQEGKKHAVYPRENNTPCTDVCSSTTDTPTCEGSPTIVGVRVKASNSLVEVGWYFNYGCGATVTNGMNEPAFPDVDVLNFRTYVKYCCCKQT